MKKLAHEPSHKDGNLSHRPSHKDGNLSHRPSHRDGNLSHRPSHADIEYIQVDDGDGDGDGGQDDVSAFQAYFWSAGGDRQEAFFTSFSKV